VKHVQRAKIVLLSAERPPVLEIAKRVGVSRPIAVGLVCGERLERLVSQSAFDADHGKAQLPQPVEQDGRSMRPVSNTIR
jgi:hypothetical protein